MIALLLWIAAASAADVRMAFLQAEVDETLTCDVRWQATDLDTLGVALASDGVVTEPLDLSCFTNGPATDATLDLVVDQVGGPETWNGALAVDSGAVQEVWDAGSFGALRAFGTVPLPGTTTLDVTLAGPGDGAQAPGSYAFELTFTATAL